MKPNLLRIFLIPALLLLLVLSFTACKKDPYQVGLNLIPPSDTLNLKSTDTVTVVAHSVLQDSVRTDETTQIMLGSLMDPVFGATTASAYLQYRLSDDAPDFGTGPVLDSVVLILPYGTIYGDSNAYQTLKVYELSQTIHYDSTYYSTRSAENTGIPLAIHTFIPAPGDSLTVGGKKVAPHIRINLNRMTRYFGNKLINAPEDAVKNSANFIVFMKGLYIESVKNPSGGALLSFDPTGSKSKIVVYFHNQDEDSLSFDFVVTSSSARFTHFDHYGYKDAAPEFRRQVILHDTTLGRSTLYVQGLGGVRVRLRFPFLDQFRKSEKIAINSAVLTVKNAQTDTTLSPPAELNLLLVDSAGGVTTVIDADEGSVYFGGYYEPSSRTYSFRITRHMQQIIDGKLTNYAFYLMANNPYTNVLVKNRITITGTNPQATGSSSDRIRLNVVYTRIQ